MLTIEAVNAGTKRGKSTKYDVVIRVNRHEIWRGVVYHYREDGFGMLVRQIAIESERSE